MKEHTLNHESNSPSWWQAIRTFAHPRVVTMLFFGFSAGIPILLIFSSSSLWLREAGVERATVTYFSWAALGYSFKFVWAPLVDQLSLPWLTTLLGRRRAWILLSQIAIMVAILMMASVDPATSTQNLTLMALAAVMLGFSSATQDIVIDAYRIESGKPEMQAMMSASYIAGYRIAMLVSGAGSLFIASGLGSSSEAYSYQAWQITYWLMSATMLIGILTTLLIKEPRNNATQNSLIHDTSDYVRFILFFLVTVCGFVAWFYFSSELVSELKASLEVGFGNSQLSALLVESFRLLVGVGVGWVIARGLITFGAIRYAMVEHSYILPVREFFERYGLSLAWLLLALVGLYRISDIVLGVISNVFYYDLGFSKPEIAWAVKTFGLMMTIIGGFAGGLLSIRYGVMRVLFLGGLLSAATNLLFMTLASAGPDLLWLYVVISADNLSAGIASAAFVAFLSSLTNISFTAMQYAIFTSLMTLLPKVLGGYSGSMVDALGYSTFFLVTALLGVPVLILIAFITRRGQFAFKLV